MHLGVLQRIFRTTPLSLEEWGLILLVGSAVALGGEVDRWRDRRKERLLG